MDGFLPHFPPAGEERFYLILLVLLLLRIRRISTTHPLLIGLVNLFGTFTHELAHLLVGLVTLAKPVGFSVWPRKRVDGSLALGSVSFQNLRFYNALPTALAPMALIFVAWLVDRHFYDFFAEGGAAFLLHLFVITLLLENAIPSTTDFRLAFGNLGGLLLYGGGALLYFQGHAIQTALSALDQGTLAF